MTGYEIFGLSVAAIFTGGLLFLFWDIATSIKD